MEILTVCKNISEKIQREILLKWVGKKELTTDDTNIIVSFAKDYSNQISVLACIDYFINGSDPLTYIKDCQDIRRFSLKERCNRGDTFILNSFNGTDIIKTDVGRTVRFYVAKSYKRLVKQYGKGTTAQIVKGYNIEIINKLPEHFPNNIDYSYYLEEARKLINEIEDTRSKKQKQKYKNVNQLNLF